MAVPEMATLYDEIEALIGAPSGDLEAIEHTLTDGYAHALALEADRWRIEKQIAQVAEALHRGNTSLKAKELAALARRRDDKAVELSRLRDALAELRRHAERVRSS